MPTSIQTDKFAQLEAEADRLREAFELNQLTVAQLEQGMKELMVQDEHGVWWTVGSKSREWFRYTGSEWVRGVPPKPVAPVPPKPPVSVPASPPISQSSPGPKMSAVKPLKPVESSEPVSASPSVRESSPGPKMYSVKPMKPIESAEPVSASSPTSKPLRKPRRLLASVVFLLGLVVAFCIGWDAGQIAYDIFDMMGDEPLLIAVIFWIIGFVLTLSTGMKLWRGKQQPSRFLATCVSLFWGVGSIMTGIFFDDFLYEEFNVSRESPFIIIHDKSAFIAIVVGGIGFLLILLVSRKLWRGKW